MIAQVHDTKFALEQAEKYYQIVKCEQCIADYNIAVKDLDNVYEKLLDIDDVYEKVENKLKELKAEKDGLKTLMEDCNSQLVLAKAKLMHLNVSTSALLKPEQSAKKLQQTQTTSTETETVEETPQNIINIPEDEQDQAIKSAISALHQDEKDEHMIDLTTDAEFPQNVTPLPSSTAPKYIFMAFNQQLSNTVETGQNIAIMLHNITITPSTVASSQSVIQTPHNIAIMLSNVITSQNIIETMQNTTVTSFNFAGDSLGLLKAAMDIAQVQPKTQTLIKIGNKIFQPVSQMQRQQVEIKQHVPEQPDIQEIESEPATSAKSFSIPE